MTILQKFSNNLETIPEKINIISAILSGIVIYFILFELKNLNYQSSNYANIFLISGIKYILFIFTIISFIIRLDEYYFYNKLKKYKTVEIMAFNDIFIITTIICLYLIN